MSSAEEIPDLRFDVTDVENCGPPAPNDVSALAQPPILYLVNGVFYLSPLISVGGPVLVVVSPSMLAVAEDLAEALATAPVTLSRPDPFTFDGSYVRLEAGAGGWVRCAFALEKPGLAVIEPDGTEALALAERLLLDLGWRGGRWEHPDGAPLEGPLVLIPSSRPEPGGVGIELPPGVEIGSERCISLDLAQQRTYLRRRAAASAGGSSATIWWTDGEVATTFTERWLLPGESCETLVERFDVLSAEWGNDDGS